MSKETGVLEPLATVTGGLLRVLLGALALFLALDLLGIGPFHVNWAGGVTCVTDGGARMGGGVLSPVTDLARHGAGVDLTPRYCAEHADGSQRFLAGLAERPPDLLLTGGLLLLYRLLRTAEQEGIHTRRAAGRLRGLAWWLLLGGLLASVLSANAEAALLDTLAHGHPFTVGAWLTLWHPPYLLFLTGCGLLTFARVLRAGAAMREDLEGTV